MSWLSKPIEKPLIYIVKTMLVIIIYNFLAASVMYDLIKDTEAPLGGLLDLPLSTMILSLIITVLIEELLFRFIPLSLGWLGGYTGMALMMIVSSIVFGYVHGGVPYIFMQGGTGLWLSAIFIKAGGGQKKFFHGFLWCSIAHLLFDFTLVGSILFLDRLA